MNFRLVLIELCLLLPGIACQAPPEKARTFNYTPPSENSIAQLFEKEGVKGTFVLLDVQNDTSFVYNPERAKAAFLPASTFKIPNTLIALELGVTNTSEIFVWDGQKRFYDKWNQDLRLKEAFRYSAVWVYQELASRIGNEAYLQWLEELNYGNAQTGPEVRNFWLNGDIRISALQQVDFLQRLEAGKLAFSENNLRLFRDLFTYEEGENYSWKAKTGWADVPDPDTGWVVGWVERGDERYIYALNIDIETDVQRKARIAIVRAVFQDMGIFSPKP